MKRLYYFFVFFYFLLVSTQIFSQVYSTADYRKAAWITCRFYGAQRSTQSSKTPSNWLLLNHGNAIDFYADASSGYDVSGGWSDCGDNVKFGQTQYYSAYMLLKGYDLWPTGYEDHYSQNYAGYYKSQDFTWEGTSHDPDGIPDILNEVKYATDYFIRCTPNGSTFYYQVGDGNADHVLWETTVKKATESNANGGEPRNVYKNPNDASMASFCGATLALMSKRYRPYDAAYADTCLNHAYKAYAYAKAHPGTAGDANGGSFYGANAKWQDDYACLCTELFNATTTAAYKTEALSYAGNLANHNYCFGYNNNDDIAAYNLATLGSSSAASLLSTLANMYKGNVTNGVYQGGNTSWGPLRYNANAAFVVALNNLYTGSTTGVDAFIYKQVDFIMGNNTVSTATVASKLSFIVGFNAISALHPHHRNVYLDDNNVANAAVLTIPSRNAQFGYMVGGVRSGSYDDTRASYQVAEGGIDYSACLVGVLAYILAQTNVVVNPTAVSVAPKPLTVPLASTATVTSTVSPTNASQTVTWSSSNTAVATVSTTGVVTGVSVGTAYIIAKTGTFKDSTLATVSKIAVTGVTVSPTSISIAVAGTSQLTLTTIPANASNQTVTWSTSDATIATISSTGLVTAVAAGTATITVTTLDGSFKATSSVVVSTSPNVVVANKTLVAPTIDGGLDENTWSLSKTITKAASGTLNNSESFGVLWDNTNLYIGVKVLDATITTSNANPYDNDGIELYFDMNHNGGVYDASDRQWIKVVNGTAIWEKIGTGTGATTTTSKVVSATKLITGGYSLEFAIPWTTLGVSPSTTAIYGMDIAVDDCDGGTARSNQGVWVGDANDYLSTTNFGQLQLSNTTVGNVTQTISLVQGWNMISFNVVPTDSSVASVFASVLSTVNEIKNADVFYSSLNASTTYNSLLTIEQGKGYLINMKSAATFTVTGLPSAYTSAKLLAKMKTGWNIVGCVSQASTAVATAFDITKISSVKNFSGFYIPSGTTNSLTTIVPSNGYFVKKN